MDPYLPHLTDILALCVTWAVGGLLLLAGAGLTGNRGAPEFQIAAGWGAFCLLLTSWGIFTVSMMAVWFSGAIRLHSRGTHPIAGLLLLAALVVELWHWRMGRMAAAPGEGDSTLLKAA